MRFNLAMKPSFDLDRGQGGPPRRGDEEGGHHVEEGDDRVTDLHLWRVGPGHLAVVASLVADQPQEPDHYKARLAGWPQRSHITIEVQRCPHGS